MGAESDGKMFRFILCVLFCFQSSVIVDAGPIKRWRQRRQPSSVGTAPVNAPPAPANLDVGPVNTQQVCPPGQVCPPQQPVMQPQVALPQPIISSAPMRVGPGGQPIIQGNPLQGLRITPRVSQEVARVDTLNADARVDRLMTALENRLGLKPQAAVTGDPHGLFNKVPRVRIELKNQDGTVTDEVEVDLRMYLMEQLTK